MSLFIKNYFSNGRVVSQRDSQRFSERYYERSGARDPGGGQSLTVVEQDVITGAFVSPGHRDQPSLCHRNLGECVDLSWPELRVGMLGRVSDGGDHLRFVLRDQPALDHLDEARRNLVIA